MNNNKITASLTKESLKQALEIMENDTVEMRAWTYYCPHVRGFRTDGCKECVELHRGAIIDLAKKYGIL